MDEIQAREMAHRILDELEKLLVDKIVMIHPDTWQSDYNEKSLFRAEYPRLEQAIVDVLTADEYVLAKES